MTRLRRWTALVLIGALLCCARALAQTSALPEGLITVEAEAFAGCAALGRVVVPEGVTAIESRAFAGSGLDSIVLPRSLKTAADDALDGCGDVTVYAFKDSYAWAWAQAHGLETVAQSAAADLEAAEATDQIVLVEYTGGSQANVTWHEKIDGVWTNLGGSKAYVGKNGIDKTAEGDKRTPTGTFNLTTPFGILEDPGSIQPYTRVTQYHYWCSTSSSDYYNQLCDSRDNGRAAGSADEVLIRYSGVYDYAMFIDYNAEGVPGKGSAIFLHCLGSNGYTSGCVAITKALMKKTICWAREGAKIVIRAAQ